MSLLALLGNGPSREMPWCHGIVRHVRGTQAGWRDHGLLLHCPCRVARKGEVVSSTRSGKYTCCSRCSPFGSTKIQRSKDYYDLSYPPGSFAVSCSMKTLQSIG